MTTKSFADPLAVPANLLFEGFDGIELDLIAHPADELKCAVPVVGGHVWGWGPGGAVGVDEVCFGSAGGALDCWAGADIDCGEDLLIYLLMGEAGVAGVDAIGGEEGFGF